MNPAPTPRTMAKCFLASRWIQASTTGQGTHVVDAVPAEFAAALERELAAKDAEIAMLRTSVDEMSACIQAHGDEKARAEKAEAELADERRYVQIEHVASWAKIQDALPPQTDARPLVQVVLDALAELAKTKKRNAELQLAVDMAVDHTAERDQLRAEIVEQANGYAATIADLNEQLAAAQGDKERIDWLEQWQGSVSRDNFGRAHVGHGGMLNWKTGQSLRAAIDHARSQLPESGKDQP